MNVGVVTIFKAGLFITLAFCGIVFDRVRNKKYTKIEIRERIEKRIEKMRYEVDKVHGEGFFDELSSGNITQADLDARRITWATGKD